MSQSFLRHILTSFFILVHVSELVNGKGTQLTNFNVKCDGNGMKFVIAAQKSGLTNPQLTNLNLKCDETGMKVAIDFDSPFNGVILIYPATDKQQFIPSVEFGGHVGYINSSSQLPLQAETTTSTTTTTTTTPPPPPSTTSTNSERNNNQLEVEDHDNNEDDEVDILSEDERPFTVFGGMDLSRLIYQATEIPPLRSSVEFDDAPPDLIDSSSSLPLQAETTTSSPTTTTSNTPTTPAASTTTTNPRDSSGAEDSSSEATTTSNGEDGTTTQSTVTTTSGKLTTTTESDSSNNTDEGFGDDEKSMSDFISMSGKSNPAKKASSQGKPSNNNFSTKRGSNVKSGSKVPPSKETSAKVETEDVSFEEVDPRSSIDATRTGVKGGGGGGGGSGVKGGRVEEETKGGKVTKSSGSLQRVPSFLPRSRRLRIRGEDHDFVSDLISRSPGFNSRRLRALSEGGRRKKKSASRSRNSDNSGNNRSSNQNGSDGRTGRRSIRRSNRKRVSEVRTWRLEPLPDNFDLGYFDIPVRASRHANRIVLTPTSTLSSSPPTSFSSRVSSNKVQ